MHASQILRNSTRLKHAISDVGKHVFRFSRHSCCGGQIVLQKQSQAPLQFPASYNKKLTGLPSNFGHLHPAVCLYSTNSPQKQVKEQTGQVEPSKPNDADTVKEHPQEHIGIFQRFKNAYKEYGKVLVGVHCVTSVVWYGSFVYAARCGVDVIPLLEYLGAGEKILAPFRSTGLGDLAVAYLMYKVATPARYTVTIGGTQLTVKYLRRIGYMQPVPEGDTLRELMKEGREQVRDRREELRDRADELRDKFKDRLDDKKDEWLDRTDEIKQELKDKKEEWRDRTSDIKQELKGRKERLTLKTQKDGAKGSADDKA